MAAVEFEHIHFFERTFVEQEVDTLAGGGFAFGVLFLNSSLAAAETRFLAQFDEIFDFLQLFTHSLML